MKSDGTAWLPPPDGASELQTPSRLLNNRFSVNSLGRNEGRGKKDFLWKEEKRLMQFMPSYTGDSVVWSGAVIF